MLLFMLPVIGHSLFGSTKNHPDIESTTPVVPVSTGLHRVNQSTSVSHSWYRDDSLEFYSQVVPSINSLKVDMTIYLIFLFGSK